MLSQTYRNLRVVLVDDGSPDNCPQICDDYSVRDDRVCVVHQENAGLSSARGAGLTYIEKAGPSIDETFIGFLDSDDWIAPDTIEYCISLLNEKKADVVQFQIYETDEETMNAKQPKERIRVCNGKEEILQYYMFSTTAGVGGDYSVCQCLFPLKAIYSERFRVGKINEDIDFKYKVLAKCHRMVVSNQFKYYYRQGEVTTSMGGLKTRDFQLREAAELLCEMCSSETYGTIAKLGRVKKARTAFSLLSKIAFFGVEDPLIDRKSTIKELTKEHRNSLFTLINSPIPINRKVLAILFAVNFNLAKTIIHFAKNTLGYV